MGDRHPGIRSLERLIGSWRTTGETRDDPPVPLAFRDDYAWMPGGHFIEHRVDGRFGEDERSQALEVIGWDEAAGGLFAQSYDSSGEAVRFRAELDGDCWRLESEAMRFEGRLLDNDRRLEGRWDRKTAEGWTPWMDIVLEKQA